MRKPLVVANTFVLPFFSHPRVCPYTCFNHVSLRRIDGYNVDIDRASFGHQVVEIETMSGKGATEIASAGDGIAKLARSLLYQDEGSSTRPVKVDRTALVLSPFRPNLTVIVFPVFDSSRVLNQKTFHSKITSTVHLALLYAPL